MKTGVTLLETAAQVSWFSQNNPDSATRGDVLAITPNAAYACQKLGLPYLKLETYAQVSQRLSQHAGILAEYLEWEAWLDSWAQQAMPEFGAADFKPARAITFMLQFLFGELWTASVSLREFLQAVQPRYVACWPPQIAGVPWYLHPTVSSWPALLPAVARHCGLSMVDLSAQASHLVPVSKSVERLPGWKGWQQWIKVRLRQNPLITDWTQLGLVGLWSHLKPAISNQSHILFSGYSYDLTPLARELRRQGAQVTVLSDILPPLRLTKSRPSLSPAFWAALADADSQLLHEPQVWTPLEKWGLDRTPLWSQPLHFWWQQLVPELWSHYQRVQTLLQQKRFAALVTWDAGGNTLSSSSVAAARKAKVPCYIYQHGSTSGNDAPNWQMYLRQSDTFLVYGPGVVEELNQSCPPSLKDCAEVVAVGSARLDMLHQSYHSEKTQKLRAQLQAGDPRPLVMYVPTFFNGYGRSLSSEQAALPDVSYFELQQTILKVWAETPAVRLVYKDFIVINDPNRLMSNYIQTHVPNALITTQRLSDLIWAVDAIVLDHVGTALGEILLTRKPLVVYMPQPNMSSPQARLLLQKRAVVAETPTEFVTGVRALLQAGQYPEWVNPDTEFLQVYGTHLNDTRSAERAAHLILAKIEPV